MLAAGCKEFLGLCQVSRKEEPPSGRAQGPERRRKPQGADRPSRVLGWSAAVSVLGTAAPAARLGLQTPKCGHRPFGVPQCPGLCRGTEGLVSPASVGDLTDPRSEEQGHAAVCPSEETGPEGEAGCVDDRLEVMVGGDQLGGGALTVLGLHWEGLSENHCQRRLSQVGIQKH